MLQLNCKPVITKPRRYSTEQRKFLDDYIAKCVEYGFIAPNVDSRWAAAPLLVAKEPSVYGNLTLDYRPVNAVTENIPSPMPHIESELLDVGRSALFSKIYFTSDYWQLPIEKSGQEALRCMTPTGVFQPLRPTQGAKNSAANLQAKVEPCFREITDNWKAWLDEFLIHAESEKKILEVLEKVF